jgi:hypothetical protein
MNTEPNDLDPSRCGWLRNGNRLGDPSIALRCGAKTRRQTPCQSPAMKNGRCRMHGGLSTGPRTPAGLERSRRAKWIHGQFSQNAVLQRGQCGRSSGGSRISSRLLSDRRSRCMGFIPHKISLPPGERSRRSFLREQHRRDYFRIRGAWIQLLRTLHGHQLHESALVSNKRLRRGWSAGHSHRESGERVRAALGQSSGLSVAAVT